MRSSIRQFVVALAILSAIFTAPADAFAQAAAFAHPGKYSGGAAPFVLQSANAKAGCFPQGLIHILTYIKKATGRKVILTSGFRPHSKREGSQHRHCKAADIRIPGMSDKSIIAIAKKAPGIGGIGQYCNGIIHVDVGPKRTWTYCGKKHHATAHGRRHHTKRHVRHK